MAAVYRHCHYSQVPIQLECLCVDTISVQAVLVPVWIFYLETKVPFLLPTDQPVVSK